MAGDPVLAAEGLRKSFAAGTRQVMALGSCPCSTAWAAATMA